MNKRNIILGGGAIAALGLFIYWQSNSPEQQTSAQVAAGASIVAVQTVAVEGNAAIGQRVFETVCASCHGNNAAGRDGIAPPLIHKIYEPSHHGDEAFQRAAAVGVRSHHWPFGDMPPVEALTRGEVAMVITYIRELQRANGIN